MSEVDIAWYVGGLITAWCIGFAGGYLLTKFHDAVRMSV